MNPTQQPENYFTKTEGFMLLVTGMCISGFLVGAIFMSSLSNSDKMWQAEAIMHGAAEFVITSPSTGETKFQWKDERK